MLFLFQLIGEFVAAPATCRRRVRSTTAQLKLPLPSTSQAATHTAPDLGTKQHDVALKLHVDGSTCMRVTRLNDSDCNGDTSHRASAIRGTCPRRHGRAHQHYSIPVSFSWARGCKGRAPCSD